MNGSKKGHIFLVGSPIAHSESSGKKNSFQTSKKNKGIFIGNISTFLSAFLHGSYYDTLVTGGCCEDHDHMCSSVACDKTRVKIFFCSFVPAVHLENE